jgi:hypothetical protein
MLRQRDLRLRARGIRRLRYRFGDQTGEIGRAVDAGRLRAAGDAGLGVAQDSLIL